jgi:hypothetical protein
VPRDLFELRPAFEKLCSDTREQVAINWDAIMADVTELPPASLLYKPPEVEIADAGTPGYFCELEGALEFPLEDAADALPLFWRNHLEMARTML